MMTTKIPGDIPRSSKHHVIHERIRILNTTIKKQNRILLAALIVLLTAAAILIAVTGGANRKNGNELPPMETESLTEEKNGAETSSAPTEKTASGKTDETEKESLNGSKKNETEKKEEVQQESAAPEQDGKEVSAMQSPGDTLPEFSAPVDNFVIKGYSAEVPVFSYTMNDYRIHRGVDIACSAGTPVLAAADGMVCEVYSDPMMGVTVGVQHSGGAVTRYKGLSEDSMNLVKNGDEVKRGQVIGASGETALIESAEEAHVHFELTINSESADPGEYMKLKHLAEIYEG